MPRRPTSPCDGAAPEGRDGDSALSQRGTAEGRALARQDGTHGSVTVTGIDALLYLPDPDPARLRAALTIEALSPGWQQSFQEMSHRLDQPPAPAPAAPGWKGFKQLP